MTTKANLLAGKYTFSYPPLVLWWPPMSHFKGKREFFLTSPWLQHLFKMSCNIPNVVKKALRQGSRQFLLSHNRNLQLPLRSLDSGRLAPLSPSCCLPVASLLLFWHFSPPVAPLSLACCFPVALLSLSCRSPVAFLSHSCRPPIAILSLLVASCLFLSPCYF